MAARRICKHIDYVILARAFLLLAATPAAAKTLTYVRDYTYQASELDSKVSSRTIALEQVKRLLLEEVGTYLMSETVVKDFEVTKDQVISFTAGIVSAVILEENWDGKLYFLRAKLSAETDDLVRGIRRIQQNEGLGTLWEEATVQRGKVLQELAKMRSESARNPGQNAPQEQYANAVKALSAVEWYQKGLARWQERYVTGRSEEINQEALHAFDNAIALDPTYADPHAQRAAIYIQQERWGSVLQESNEALKLNPNHVRALTFRGRALSESMHYQEALQDLTKATSLAPTYSWAWCFRSQTYFQLTVYSRALEDADNAIEVTKRSKNSCGYYRRGRALAALTRFQEAVESFDRGSEREPRFAPSYLHRGYALAALGKSDQALEDFKKAARLGNGEAQDYLNRKGIRW